MNKYLTFMEVGMAHWLAIPVALMLAAMYGFMHVMHIVVVLMTVAGAIWLAIGADGREKLKAKQDQTGGDDAP